MSRDDDFLVVVVVVVVVSGDNFKLKKSGN